MSPCNGITVTLKDGEGNAIPEHTASKNVLQRVHRERIVVAQPGSHFTINVTVHPNFYWFGTDVMLVAIACDTGDTSSIGSDGCTQMWAYHKNGDYQGVHEFSTVVHWNQHHESNTRLLVMQQQCTQLMYQAPNNWRFSTEPFSAQKGTVSVYVQRGFAEPPSRGGVLRSVDPPEALAIEQYGAGRIIQKGQFSTRKGDRGDVCVFHFRNMTPEDAYQELPQTSPVSEHPQHQSRVIDLASEEDDEEPTRHSLPPEMTLSSKHTAVRRPGRSIKPSFPQTLTSMPTQSPASKEASKRRARSAGAGPDEDDEEIIFKRPKFERPIPAPKPRSPSTSQVLDTEQKNTRLQPDRYSRERAKLILQQRQLEVEELEVALKKRKLDLEFKLMELEEEHE